MTTQRKKITLAASLICLAGTALAYSGFNNCQRYTGLSAGDQKTYKKSTICVPVANLTTGPISVTLLKSKTQGDTRSIMRGNVGDFTHNQMVKRDTSFDVIVKNKSGKVIYDSVNGKDPKVANLVGLLCMRSISKEQAQKTISAIPGQAKFGPDKCVAWTAIKPKKGFGPD